MINTIHLLAYITVVLIITWLVLDLTEARRVSAITKQEQVFVIEQRAICNFMNRTLSEHNPVSKRTLEYQQHINYTVYEPRNSSNQHLPTIVIIPGALQSPNKHEYVQSRLACVGVRSICIPMSIIRNDIKESFDELVIQTLKFIDHVRVQVGSVACIVGHSLGGLIALRIALIDDQSTVAAFQPFLGLSVSPSTIITKYFTLKLVSSGAQPIEGNDIAYVFRNYGFILEAQKHTVNQAIFLKSRVLLFVSTHEHLIDNEQVVAFARAGRIPLTYMHQSHHFGKNEACLDTLEALAKQNLQ